MHAFGIFLKEVAAPALIACWVAWLAYGAIAGAAGYRALAQLREEAAAEAAALEEVRARRQALERRADLLNPRSIDPDMVDERVRAVLGYAREGDIVLPAKEVERLLAPEARKGGAPEGLRRSGSAPGLVSAPAGA